MASKQHKYNKLIWKDKNLNAMQSSRNVTKYVCAYLSCQLSPISTQISLYIFISAPLFSKYQALSCPVLLFLLSTSWLISPLDESPLDLISPCRGQCQAISYAGHYLRPEIPLSSGLPQPRLSRPPLAVTPPAVGARH